MAHTQLSVGGPDADVRSLWDWLGDVPELRGGLRLAPAAAGAGEMGADLVVAVVLSAATLARAVAPLARALSDYLVERERQRRSDVVVVTGPGGRVEFTAERICAPDAERLLRQVLLASAGDAEGVDIEGVDAQGNDIEAGELDGRR